MLYEVITPIADKKEREEFVKGWDAAPERFKKWFLEWEPRTHPSIEESVHICDWNETMHYIDDAIGTCAFLSRITSYNVCYTKLLRLMATETPYAL